MRHKTHRTHTLLFVGLALLLLAQPVSIVMAQTERPTPTPTDEIDPRFGVIESFWEPSEAAELGVGWDRILFYWNEIQPTGPEDWNTLHVLEEWLTEARAQDRMVMGLLKNTPAWATDGEPFSGVPRGLDLPIDDPDNLWANYVRRVVEYYAPLGVHHWIVWNEPEIDPGVYGHEFSGTTAEYYRLLKVAYLVAKEHDPQAVIHLAGWSYWHDPQWLAKFLNVATADPEGPANNYFFDVITLHIYFRVETVEQLVEETWTIQERFGLRKPIWINETNASPNLDPLWPVERPSFQVDLEQQAWYLVQAHALAYGAGTARVGVYKLLDVLLPPGGESFGILRPDASRRPAFDAYQTIVRYLGGFTYPVMRQATSDFYVFTFRRPAGITRILWARTADAVTVRLPALTDEALLVSATGEERSLRALKGYYQVRLGGARCSPACDIGGPPVFVVESGAGDTRAQVVATVDPTRAILATPTVTPTADRRPRTATPTATSTPQASATPTATETATASPTAAASPTTPATPTLTATPQVVTLALAASPAPAATPTVAPAEMGNRVTTSWLFIGAAVVLGAILAFFVIRQRHV
ncbi:hypothetical protein [Promineifilum sp.]|uniref:hypothetical protein n=1 Tax=Promineifilum sp. TaxID=2664178 RepID=UPI0035AE87F5